MRETAELTFATSEGRRVIRVPDPIANISQAALDVIANMFVTANPFNATIGDLTKLKSAMRATVSSVVLIG